MKPQTREILFIAGVVVLAAWAHSVLRYGTFSVLLLPIFVSILVTYVASVPTYYLLILAVIAELYSSFPPGVMTLVVLVPWLVRSVMRERQPTLSFTFLVKIVVTVILQLAILSAIEVINLALLPEMDWMSALGQIPVRVLAIIVLVTGAVTYAAAILWQEITPRNP